jgi:CDP-diacylglycerol--glycerol-3-phosphate 3-phosphatidyltransferase
MYFSDLLDGFLARRNSQVSEFGKVIDPLADKIAVIFISLSLLYIGKLPLWFFVIIAVRDLLILGFGMYLNSSKDIRLMSNYSGKLAVFTIGLVILISVIDNDALSSLKSVLYFVSIALIMYSSYVYFRRYLDAIHGKAE